MSRYHFFKLDHSLTYLDTTSASYGDERRQLVDQGFAPIAAPSFADTPAEALAILRNHEELQEELKASAQFDIAMAIPAAITRLLGKD